MSQLKSAIFKYVPAIGSLANYRVDTLRRDAFAGFTVAAVAVPQSMAYATIIGLPTQYGMYTAIVMTIVGALFDSSKHLINGPTNVISIATLSALASVPEENRIAATIMMTLMIGVIQLGITLLRIGDFSRFISHAVIVGFTAGASVLLILDQWKNVMGWKAMGDAHDHFLKRFYLTATEGGAIHPATVTVALFTIAVILVFRFINRRWRLGLPEFLLGLVAASLLTHFSGWSQAGVSMVSAVPRQLPGFQVPTVNFSLASELASSATAIALLGLLEAIAMGKSLAAMSGQRLDMNQQCLSEGLANLTGSFFQCIPGSGSLTRSYINQQSGAVTQWSGVISAIMVGLTVLFFAPLATYVPRAALAGVLLLTASRMIDYRALTFHMRATRFDAIIVIATAFSAVFVSIEYCVLIGVLLSFFMYIPRAAKLYLSELTVGSNRVVRELRADDRRCSLYRIYNLEGELFFGSSTELENVFDRIQDEIGPEVQVILIRLKRARNPDAVCLKLFSDFVDRMQQRQIVVVLSGVHASMRQSFINVGLLEKLGQDRVFLESAEIWSSTIQAVKHIYEILGERRCEICQQKSNASADDNDFHFII
jgi:sulfate permease, SulP family